MKFEVFKSHLLLLIAILMLLIAIVPMPYDYYTLLKFYICFAGIKEAYSLFNDRKAYINIFLTWCLIIVLYNPLFKIAFTKQAWIFINIITICYLVYYILFKDNINKNLKN